MDRNGAIGFNWVLIIALAFGTGCALIVSELAHLKVFISASFIICFYVILHIKMVSHNLVFLVLSFSVGWLFLCQSPLYGHYHELLSTGRWLAIGMTGAVCLIAGIHDRRKMRVGWIVSAPFLMGAYCFLTMLWSVSPELTMGRSISVMLLGVTVVGTVWYMGNWHANLHETIKAIVLPVTFLFWVLTLFYGFDSSLLERGYLRTSGPMLNPNGVGILGAFLAPVAYYVWRTRGNKNIFWLASFLTSIVMVILSGTRSALSATLFAFFLITIRGMRSFSVHALFSGVATSILAIGLLIVDVYGMPEIVQTYLRTENLPIGSGRFEAWNVTFDLLRQRPWTGYGFGTEDMLFETFGIQFLKHGGAMVHNSYLGLSVQIGILGAAIFFLLMFLVFVKALQVCMKTKDLAIIVLTGTLISGLVISFTESWLYSAGNSQSLPFWILFGILVRLLVDRRFTGSGTFIGMQPLQGDSRSWDQGKTTGRCQKQPNLHSEERHNVTYS